MKNIQNQIQNSVQRINKDFLPVGCGDMSSVIRAALRELGLTEDYLLRVLSSLNFDVSMDEMGEVDYGSSDISVWKLICDLLYLPLDCVSLGYVRYSHCCKIGHAIQNGTYLFPQTRELKKLFSEFIQRERQGWRDENVYLGSRLQKLRREERYRNAILKRTMRKKNFTYFKSLRDRFLEIFNFEDLFIKNELHGRNFICEDNLKDVLFLT